MSTPTLCHPLVEKWQKGKATLNGWISLAHPFAAEIMAQHGFDSITIDSQHGISSYSDLVTLLPPIQATQTSALVRIPWLSADHVMKTLDAGASGIICPMINSPEEAEKLVAWSYYPPMGERSFGPIRAKWVYGNDYAKQANKKLLIIAMIETQQAIDCLDEILAIDGIDAFYIGPADLSINLGLPPQFDQTHPTFYKALDIIVDKVKSKNKYLGIHNGTVTYAKQMIKKEFNFVTVGSDANFISAGAQQTVLNFKQNDHLNKENNLSGY